MSLLLKSRVKTSPLARRAYRTYEMGCTIPQVVEYGETPIFFQRRMFWLGTSQLVCCEHTTTQGSLLNIVDNKKDQSSNEVPYLLALIIAQSPIYVLLCGCSVLRMWWL